MEKTVSATVEMGRAVWGRIVWKEKGVLGTAMVFMTY